MTLKPTISNPENPPPGGWNVRYPVPERPGEVIDTSRHDWKGVVDQICAWRRNNDLPEQRALVMAFCDVEWCKRAPDRAPQGSAMVAAGSGRRHLTPVDYGPACWMWLNTFGVFWDSAHWATTIKHIAALLNPNLGNVNYGSGCAECFDHFNEFLSRFPWHKVYNRDDAAVCVWMAHDNASHHAKKSRRPQFPEMAMLYGWEPKSEQQIAEIIERLKA